jgi:secretion/DNA translocation related TadE-like protein
VTRSDRGSGTVLVLGLIGLVLALTGGVAAVGVCAVARHRAEASADLAALAAAAADLPSSACSRARTVATAGGAVLVDCRALGDGSVVVDVAVPVALAGDLVRGATPLLARARARAGTPPGGAEDRCATPGCPLDLYHGSAQSSPEGD